MTRLSYGLALIVLLLTPPGIIRAQDGPQIGFTAGMNVTSLEAPGADTGVRQMFAGGLVAQMGLIGRLSLQSELLLDQKGAAVRGGGEAIRYGASYVTLPVLLRLRGPSFGDVSPYLVGGGFGGVKVFERQRGGSGGRSLPLNTSTSFFKRTDAGLTGGLAGTIPLGGGRRLTVAVRYAHGLVDVDRTIDRHPFRGDDGQAVATFPENARTRTVSILVRFGL